jgi:tetratricopeptide (TPR) repeat protein
MPSSTEHLLQNQTVISHLEISHPDAAVPGLLPRLAQICREHVVALATCAAALVAIVVVASFLILQSRAIDEVALRNHAQQLEQQKHWPAAIKEYENLGARGGDLASFGVDHAKSLRDLVDQENSLLTKARDDETRGNYSEATQLYQQAANLHGDKEREALSAMGRLHKEEIPTAEKPPAPPKPAALHKPDNERRVVETTPPAPAGRGCQLLPRDIPFYLDRADRNRASGDYGDAERLYNSVLDCDPQNPRAVAGLNKTKQAKAVPNR